MTSKYQEIRFLDITYRISRVLCVQKVIRKLSGELVEKFAGKGRSSMLSLYTALKLFVFLPVRVAVTLVNKQFQDSAFHYFMT